MSVVFSCSGLSASKGFEPVDDLLVNCRPARRIEANEVVTADMVKAWAANEEAEEAADDDDRVAFS